MFDYNFARDELMLNELSNDPIQTAIAQLEKQHEADKQGIEYPRNVRNVRGLQKSIFDHNLICLIQFIFSRIGETTSGIRTSVPTLEEYHVAVDAVPAVHSVRSIATREIYAVHADDADEGRKVGAGTRRDVQSKYRPVEN